MKRILPKEKFRWLIHHLSLHPISNSFSADSNSDLEKVAEIDKMPQVGTSSSHMNVSEHSASEEPHVDSPKASSEHTESQAMVDGS